MSVDSLRISRGGATVIFTEFTRLKHKFNNSLFCSFEGDDSKYYFKRIENETKYSPDNIIIFTCSGKKEVLRFYRIIQEKGQYQDVKMLYFLDKDFDLSIKKEYPNAYETPCYSIENLYSTQEAFMRIVKIEFAYKETDDEYSFLLDSYAARQKEFHDKTLLFNAWLACERENAENEKSSKVNLTDFNFQNIVTSINLDSVETKYDKELIEKFFPDAVKISDEKLQQKTQEFEKCDKQKTFRGKYEIDFLYGIIEAIKSEFRSARNAKKRLSKKPGVQLNQSKKNLISEFSQHASTPDCLIEYLNKFHKAA